MNVASEGWLTSLKLPWTKVALKRVFRIVNGGTPKGGEEANWNGDICWATPEDLGKITSDTITQTKRRLTLQGYQSCGTTLIPTHSLVLSTRAPIGHVAIAGVPMCTNQGCRGLVPRKNDSSRFYYYVLLAAKDDLQAKGQGTTFQELGQADLGLVEVPRPTPEEQNAITTFLDRETGRIDEIVAKRRRTLDLLAAVREAAITDLISTCSSGRRMALKHVLSEPLLNGLFKKKDRFGDGTKFVNVVDAYQDNFTVDVGRLEAVQLEDGELLHYCAKPGDVLIVRSSLKKEASHDRY